MNKQLWNKALKRALVGMPLGVTISTVITIIISLCKEDGHYYAVVPALAAECGSEACAVLVQFLCSLLYGAVFAGASVIWESDWSLTKMTVVHLLVISLVTLPIAWFMQWMNHTVGGFLLYIGIFLAIYLIIWIIGYARMRKGVDDLNRKVRRNV